MLKLSLSSVRIVCHCGISDSVTPLGVLMFETGRPRGRREQQADVMKGREARANDGDVLGAQSGECAAYGVGIGRGFGGEDGELNDGDIGGWIDEFHGNEDAVVPACVADGQFILPNAKGIDGHILTYPSYHPPYTPHPHPSTSSAQAQRFPDSQPHHA
jgi:hypothetical protein